MHKPRLVYFYPFGLFWPFLALFGPFWPKGFWDIFWPHFVLAAKTWTFSVIVYQLLPKLDFSVLNFHSILSDLPLTRETDKKNWANLQNVNSWMINLKNYCLSASVKSSNLNKKFISIKVGSKNNVKFEDAMPLE